MMLPLHVNPQPGEPLKILALGAHSDDLEIGCGATIAKLVQSVPQLNILWTVFSSNAARKAEAWQSAQEILAGVDAKRIEIHAFRDGHFPYVAADIKDCFESIKDQFQPHLIFTHHLKDRHQDHRTVADLTWNTFRDHLILEYEIPKVDGDLGHPNLYVQVSEELAQQKAARLLKHFGTQRNRHWFCEETFLGLMRIRGLESGASAKYAEAFHARKVALGYGLR